MDECRTPEGNQEIIIPLGYEHIVEPAQYEAVEKTWRKWNQQVRDFLRAETGFKLSVDRKQHTINVRVTKYVSDEFDVIIKQIGMENWLLGEKRPLLNSLLGNASYLENYIDRNSRAKDQLGLSDSDIEALRSYPMLIACILERLPQWQIEIRKRLREVEGDWLGRYIPRTRDVELNWIPIAIYCKSVSIPIEDLTIVVLAHELAHAYSHAGMDIDGNFWDTDCFLRSDLSVVEGLAQYFTLMFLRKIEQSDPGPLNAFVALLTDQASPYHAHELWAGASDIGARGEAIRLALLDARMEERGCTYDRFNQSFFASGERFSRP